MSITFIFGLIMIFMNNIFAMEPEKDKNKSISPIIQDIEVLKPYYQAIQQIRTTLEEAASKFSYKINLEPNPYFFRTPKYIFLETSIVEGEDVLCNLYTPFGQVQLLTGGLATEKLEISKEFLKNMKWHLEDVTDFAHICQYIQKDHRLVNSIPFQMMGQDNPLVGISNPSKLYVIPWVGSIKLDEDLWQGKLIIFDSLFFTSICDQWNKDRALLKELSNGY